MSDQIIETRATSEIERPRRALMTVDFMTAFSVEECRRWLEYAADQLDTRRVELWDDDSFTVWCCDEPNPNDPYDDSAARPFEVRFWGTLEPRERGTWVWGTSIERPSEAEPRRRLGFPPMIIVVILMTLVLETYLRGARSTMLVWLAVLIGLGVWSFWMWWKRHRTALDVTLWIWETLYVKPPKRDQDEEEGDQRGGDDGDA